MISLFIKYLYKYLIMKVYSNLLNSKSKDYDYGSAVMEFEEQIEPKIRIV